MPSMMNTAVLGLLATAAKVAAHGFVDELNVDGVTYAGYIVTTAAYSTNPPKTIGWSETATNLGFVSPSQYTTSDIICHLGAKNAALSAPIKGGGNIKFHWNTWPESHKGCVLNYLASCGDDCTTVDKTTLKWFKISEAGLLDNTAVPGRWAADDLRTNNFTGSVTIPASVRPGKYVVRHEIISLHGAANPDGAQNYPFCFNIEISGSGTEAPEGVLGTALYTPTDPGIKYDLYSGTGRTYPMPGPPLKIGGGSSGSSGSAPVDSAPPASTPAPGTSSPPGNNGGNNGANGGAGAPPTTMSTSAKPPTGTPGPSRAQGSSSGKSPTAETAADDEGDACAP
ncbi:related to endoglucanase [Rhynchosporium secalis]|uniref:Related to endoglucanase n=1 Tax=Rhynchosporium secalis TaxID=38038 RepID=A0A1E1M7X7_RHYSE|nr:related to endoglucanase [Rhynchosporium secalis]